MYVKIINLQIKFRNEIMNFIATPDSHTLLSRYYMCNGLLIIIQIRNFFWNNLQRKKERSYNDLKSKDQIRFEDQIEDRDR